MTEALSTANMKGILTDVTLCIGCERCVEGCTQVNKLPDELPKKRLYLGDGLSGRRLTTILRIPGTRETVRKHCLHCLEPACAAACLVGAFTKRPDGPVVYDASKCIGCRYCMLACPFNIPRYEWESLLPYVRKCKMNEECRVEGGMPVCVSACPTGATIFGNRDDLIKEARRRFKAKPGKYLEHIYGEHEFGGTSVLFISDVPIGKLLGFPAEDELQKIAQPNLAESSIPRMNEPWVKFTPVWAAGIFTGLWGVWLLRRRSLLMKGGPADHGPHGAAPAPVTAGIDQVCQEKPSRPDEAGGE